MSWIKVLVNENTGEIISTTKGDRSTIIVKSKNTKVFELGKNDAKKIAKDKGKYKFNLKTKKLNARDDWSEDEGNLIFREYPVS